MSGIPLKTRIDDLIRHQGRYALFHYSRPAKVLNLIRSFIQLKLRRPKVSSYPYKMIVDVTNLCNLKCPHCPTGKQVAGRPKGSMGLESFGRILHELGNYIYIIDLFNWGEPFLNKHLFQMISMAEQKKICTSIHTNLNVRMGDKMLAALLESDLSFLVASLDGADQETYALYRKGGSLDRALDNARRIIERRKATGRRKPYLTWQFLVFPHNAHQVDEARRLSGEIGFDRFVIMKGIMDRSMRSENLRVGRCDWLWTTAALHWNNRIGPCCLQFMARDDFGEFGDDDFMSVWNNEKFQYARSLFSGKRQTWQNIMCEHCYKVRGLREAGTGTGG